MPAHFQEAALVILRSIMDLKLQAYLVWLHQPFTSVKLRCFSLAIQADFRHLFQEILAVIIFVFIFPYRGLLYFALGFQIIDMGSDGLLDRHRLECLLTFYWIRFHYSSFLLWCHSCSQLSTSLCWYLPLIVETIQALETTFLVHYSV